MTNYRSARGCAVKPVAERFRGVGWLAPQPWWRIRPNAKVVPVPPPVRKINSKGTTVLNARRAGNRGKSKRHLKTTPVFG